MSFLLLGCNVGETVVKMNQLQFPYSGTLDPLHPLRVSLPVLLSVVEACGRVAETNLGRERSPFPAEAA